MTCNVPREGRWQPPVLKSATCRRCWRRQPSGRGPQLRHGGRAPLRRHSEDRLRHVRDGAGLPAGLRQAGPVILVDTDPQGSLGHWWEARAEDQLHFADAQPREQTERGQVVTMLFCQIAQADSLREICGGLAVTKGKLKTPRSVSSAEVLHSFLCQRATALTVVRNRLRATTRQVLRAAGADRRWPQVPVPQPPAQPRRQQPQGNRRSILRESASGFELGSQNKGRIPATHDGGNLGGEDGPGGN